MPNKLKIMSVVGARPEFIQIAPFSRAARRRHTEILVHTGQHYDPNMSDVFFADLDIAAPEIHLGVGSGSHAEQTGQIMIRLEEAMLRERPDWVVVLGDTNSTLAGALVAAKLCVPLAHIEAGLRSYDRTMPEEINRIVTDHVSTVLFPPTQVGVDNLRDEGITQNVFNVGDVRMDVVFDALPRARGRQSALLARIGLAQGQPFALATIHRASNTDDPDRLRHIVTVLNGAPLPIVLPAHPRLRKMMQMQPTPNGGLSFGPNVRAIDPVGFLDMLALLDACAIVITDSGGLQKEAYMLRRPTITVRSATEWTETVASGWNRLCEPEAARFNAAIAEALAPPPADHPDFYGTPGVCERMIDVLEQVSGG